LFQASAFADNRSRRYCASSKRKKREEKRKEKKRKEKKRKKEKKKELSRLFLFTVDRAIDIVRICVQVF